MLPTAYINQKDVSGELNFTTSRSGGPGGQNVNKVESKVSLRFDVQNSQFLSEREKETILRKLASRINTEGVLIVTAQNSRSQLQNKAATIVKFNELIEKAFARKKTRRPTKPTKSSVKKRLNEKKMQSEKKKLRQNL